MVETAPRQAALVDVRKLAKIFIMSAGQGFSNVQHTNTELLDKVKHVHVIGLMLDDP